MVVISQVVEEGPTNEDGGLHQGGVYIHMDLLRKT